MIVMLISFIISFAIGYMGTNLIFFALGNDPWNWRVLLGAVPYHNWLEEHKNGKDG